MTYKLLSSKLEQFEEGMILHYCPGCDMLHPIYTSEYKGDRPRWTWNGDVLKPSYSPSVVVNSNHRCHYFMKDGKIQYLNDCSHEYAGKTIDLPDIPEDWL